MKKDLFGIPFSPVKAIYWRQYRKAYLSLLMFFLALILMMAIYYVNYGHVSTSDPLLLLFVIIMAISAHAYHYYNREQKVLFDDENDILEIDRGSVYFISNKGKYGYYRVQYTDVSDVFDWFSFKTGIKTIKYSEIEFVRVEKSGEGRVIIIGYKGPWDTTLKIRLYENEVGRDNLWAIAGELKKRSRGEDYEYVFEDLTGLTTPASFVTETGNSLKMAPYKRK